MPIPILLAGLGAVAGIVGAGGHLSAKETNKEAQRVLEEAQKLYDDEKASLEQAQNKTKESLLKLGYAKRGILESSIRQFVDAYDRLGNIGLEQSTGIQELSRFPISRQEVLELRKMSDIYSSSIKSGAAGAATGALITLAANGSLSMVTGGFAALAADLGVGMTAGAAASSLAASVAAVPLAAIAAPVVLFTGISASIKADENLEKATATYAEAEAAVEKMKVQETLCGAIADRAEMFRSALERMNRVFSECSGRMAGMIRKKEGKIFKKKLTSQDFSGVELAYIGATGALALAVKTIIDTPILSKDGQVSPESKKICESKLAEFSGCARELQEIQQQMDYDVKPVTVRAGGRVKAYSSAPVASTTVLGGARSVLAFVLGILLAGALAGRLADYVTGEFGEFLFLESVTANQIALWLVICASVIMIVGKFGETIVEKGCGLASGVGLSILFVQYCRTVEEMDHYIIFSVVVFAVSAGIFSFFQEKRGDWSCGSYFYDIWRILALYPILFWIYTILSGTIGLPRAFCLAAASVLILLAAIGCVRGTADD